ncbi:MAG: hypothetical protein PUB99_06400, partial [Oscillospiraceae bacterium]|nr:hypothetical protein [Oscillospiraceae bacterium]
RRPFGTFFGNCCPEVYLQAMAVTVMAAAARMEATMIAVMVFSPFTDVVPCSAGGDQGDDDGGGCQDGSDDDCGHDFLPLSLSLFYYYFSGFSLSPSTPIQYHNPHEICAGCKI